MFVVVACCLVTYLHRAATDPGEPFVLVPTAPASAGYRASSPCTGQGVGPSGGWAAAGTAIRSQPVATSRSKIINYVIERLNEWSKWGRVEWSKWGRVGLFGMMGPVDEGPVDEGPVDEGPVDEGPVDEAVGGRWWKMLGQRLALLMLHPLDGGVRRCSCCIHCCIHCCSCCIHWMVVSGGGSAAGGCWCGFGMVQHDFSGQPPFSPPPPAHHSRSREPAPPQADEPTSVASC